MSFDLVIYNGVVVTVNPRLEIIANGVIGIRADKITHIGQTTETNPVFDAKETIDAQGGIIMPGLINTHTHLPMSLFSGLADDLPLQQWLETAIFPIEAKYVNPEFVYAAASLSCAELILSGTTTCCDGYFLEHHVALAIETAGIRAITGQGVIDFPAPGVPNPDQNLLQAELFIEQWLDKNPLIQPSVFCHSPYTCSTNTLQRAKRLANKYNVLFQIHAAETRRELEILRSNEGLSPIAYLDLIQVLDPSTLLVHVVWVDESDIEIIARRGSGIAVATESEMKLASGIAPAPKFIKAGIPTGLGTDGRASNNNQDLFEEMDVTAKLHKVSRLDPVIMDAPTVLRLATINGAKAIGLGDQIGSLEVNKQADIIIVDVQKPHLTPMYNPISHLVYSAKGADVRDVWVAGKPIMRDRKLLTLNLPRILGKAQEIGRCIQTDFYQSANRPNAMLT